MLNTTTFNAQLTQNNGFWAYVDKEGNILSQSAHGVSKIGINLERFNQVELMLTEAVGKAEGYKQQLIDAGLIVVPLTDSEKIAQLTEQVSKLTELLLQRDTVQQNTNEVMNYGYQENAINGTDGASEGQCNSRETNSSRTTSEPIPTEQTGSGHANAKVQSRSESNSRSVKPPPIPSNK